MRKEYKKALSKMSSEELEEAKHYIKLNEHNDSAKFIFIAIYIIGYILQFGVTGSAALIMILNPFSWAIRSLYFCLGWVVLENNIKKNNYTQLIILELLYLVTSTLIVGNDYDCMFLWFKPPHAIKTLSFSLAAITIILSLIFLIINKTKDKKNNIKNKSNNNGPTNILHGVITYPIIIFIGYFLIFLVHPISIV